ncbi:MAG: zinc ribbon domain-containing protein [Candidatus Lokiarchaeota archaeon]|nr:zinc ribbon domain-containing protein [Candidatus Lokiarchaeota archaeon]
MKFCVYCGNPVKPNDKYCIACGKPLLTNSAYKEAATGKKEKEKVASKQVEILPKEEEEIKPKKEEKEVEKENLGEDEESKPENFVVEAIPLPDDVKHQIDLYIRSTEIDFNKQTLSQKLTDILNETKSAQYETDFDFKQKTNVKLEAVKQLISDLKQEESEIKGEMDDVFIIKRLNKNIDTKVFQLKNLTREYRLKKMNKETFEKLREKYKTEKDSADMEKAELLMGIKLWIQELKTEKTELMGDKKLNKGRFSSKEITQEQYKTSDADYKIKIEKLTKKIATLEDLSK